MNTASLELCNELFELSGWETEKYYWQDNRSDEYIPELRKLELIDYKPLWLHSKDNEDNHVVPAYDLGYLLRELPHPTLEQNVYGIWIAKWHKKTPGKLTGPMNGHGSADTPEDAACKLAIELFKSGVLKRGEA
jgi:hypothetical protein